MHHALRQLNCSTRGGFGVRRGQDKATTATERLKEIGSWNHILYAIGNVMNG